MKNRQATRMFGMTVMGGITVNGPMFDIHDNQHLHFYNHDMKPEVKNQARAEEAEEETWEMKELKFFDMKKFDTAEKQLKLSKALRVSAKVRRSSLEAPSLTSLMNAIPLTLSTFFSISFASSAAILALS